MKVKIFYISALTVLLSLSATTGPALAQQGQTVKKGIVILVEFPDVRHTIDSNSVEMRFSQQLNNYIRQMSYNKVLLDISVTKNWFMMPDAIGPLQNISEES